MTGPDLPQPEQPFTAAVVRHRWPTGTVKIDLYDGIPVFHGRFDERDVEIARRAYPGRRVLLNDSGGIEVYPAGATRTIHEMFLDHRSRGVRP